MIRFCPNCESERPLQEIFCEGRLQDRECGWDLSSEPIHPAGWRPQQLFTRETKTPRAETRTCTNGHPLDDGDLLCLDCGAGPDSLDAVDDGPASDDPAPTGETVIDGWHLLREISHTDGVRTRYLSRRDGDDRQAVLTLYRSGAEPDPSIYAMLRRLPRAHVPEILATGRWDERAYEVGEALTGGTLADLGIVVDDLSAVRHVVRELGLALHAFAEVGLRHRDLRPDTLLVRSREPLDLVISGFGSARLSEFDLDIVSPLETSRYMAPEAIAGGVAAASDWWSLGMLLLEQLTRGACFEGVHANAFLIHVLANGVSLPPDLSPELSLLLRGLLARDRHQRWQWPQVQAWLNGEAVDAPPATVDGQHHAEGATIALGERRFHGPAAFALAAAEPQHWPQALDHLLRGVVVTWAEQIGEAPRRLAGLRQIAQHAGLEDDARLMLALKVLNPDLPLVQRGEIVTPGWLLEHPLEGYALISGPVPDLLEQLEPGHWLIRLKTRIALVRQRAAHQRIDLDEDSLRIYLLATSRARLAAQWADRQRLLPDSDHPGVLALADRTTIAEEDLIVLLSAGIDQFRAVDTILNEAAALAREHVVQVFERDAARALLLQPRTSLYRHVDTRIEGFARCNITAIDAWAERFRLERRMPLAQALVLLALPPEHWMAPQKQQYVSQVLDFFEKKVASAVLRGPLVRMRLGRTTARIDLRELDSERRPAAALLDHLLQRGAQDVTIDPEALTTEPTRLSRLNALQRHSALYQRDTGIDGMYMGFPFLLTRDGRSNTRTRIAPVLLWPVHVRQEVGNRGHAALAFDNAREEVRLNPALESLLGVEACNRWRKVADELLGRSALKAADVMDAFGMLATARTRVLASLPPPDTEVEAHQDQLACAAVLFHVTFMGQAIGEDLRLLKSLPPGGTGLETALRLRTDTQTPAPTPETELQRFLTVASDPSQEAAILQARQAPGLLVEGPPGTGKSQTIVNMVGDAIGHQRSLLIVCQKHAALEVVRKRLVAEGLGDRLVMIDDVNRDREPVIRSVRAQLESLFASDRDPRTLERQRERIAARIGMHEGELDRLHQGLHRIDAQTGLSYRQILGELIALEGAGEVIDAPTLRQPLATLDLDSLTRFEEACAPLIRLWLPARYEGSPLSQLRVFASDPATLQAFEDVLRDFCELERARDLALQTHPAGFEIDDPAPYRAWLTAHAATVLALPPLQRQWLARWLPLFRGAAPEGARDGDLLLQQLVDLVSGLQQCDAAACTPTLSPALGHVSDTELRRIADDSRRVTTARGWWRHLHPGYRIGRRRLLRFIDAQTGQADPAQLPALLAAARLELQWRPLRRALSQMHQTLGLAAVAADAGPTLATLASTTLDALRNTQSISRALEAGPRSGPMDAAVLTGELAAFEAVLVDVDAALLRHVARQDSLTGLQTLASWIDDACEAGLRSAIAGNHSQTAALAQLQAAVPHLSHYQQFRARAVSLTANDFKLLARLRACQSSLDNVPARRLDTEFRRLLNREARLGWKQRLEQENPQLLFEQQELQPRIDALAEADAQMRQCNRELLGTGIDVTRLGTRKQWEDVTRLTGRRSRRLREFVELGAPLGLMHLRPVWLMNPDVASRVLPLAPGLFDTVIYDEASQMPVEFALPTLYRGRVTVVSGDEKQMPPTAFFSSRVENDEAELFDGQSPDEDADEAVLDAHEDTWNRREIKDCPDLLQLARSVLPVTTLQIHYRSAYRELINFSNAAFYQDDLNVPVRHPQSTIAARKPLELRQIDGVYKDQCNADEADHVVEYLAALWQQPHALRPSVGVVTFNRKQADLIEERLELRAADDDDFRSAYGQERERIEGGEDMSVFVKNVENVQGDERDIIVFSSTFGRNGQGSFRRNFGVLGQTGGERRLNVAVTRARSKVVMVTSMPIGQVSDMFDTQRAPQRPRDYLQGYLEYARALSSGEFDTGRALLRRVRSGQVRTRSVARTGPDGVGTSVADYLQSMGWAAAPADAGDAFHLDFAIEDPETGLYAIGIECDTPRHALLERARAREIWRPSVLRRAIPHLHRVSSLGWYQDGARERALLRAAVEHALTGAHAPNQDSLS
ncbi:MAG: AAA domain-containing protein [Luteimonas sp.]